MTTPEQARELDNKLGLVGEPGWVELAPPEAFEDCHGFVSTDPFGPGIRMRLFRREATPKLVGKLWLGPKAQGPPGCGHGGCIAAVLDETMGAAAWTEGHCILALELTSRYRQRLPLEEVVRLEAWIERVDGRKVYTKGQIVAADGEPYAEAQSFNLSMTPEQIAEFTLNPMMVNWKRWADEGRRP